jgi:hypothetical protein
MVGQALEEEEEAQEAQEAGIIKNYRLWLPIRN